MEAVQKMRGSKNSEVSITITRENIEKPKDLLFTRAIIPIKSVKAKIFDDNIGYI
jgi:carboxyl-terminal processing protease